ncbi:hypothetical protein ABMA28_000380 [Loxostege sticticalis]|uniref:FLYWCH-type domain-containing protein n=1 Tax=Loxostege sticticalis TaxID=481309 RepID=A0ABD0TSK8_LOXSC
MVRGPDNTCFVLEMEDLPSTTKDDAFKIIPSQRGGNILMRNGYRYTLRRINLNGHKVWRCANRKICSAYLTTKTRFTKFKSIVVPGKFKPFLLAVFLEKNVDLGSTHVKNSIIPVCYALLPDKIHHTYTVLFELIKSQAMTAITTVFPNAILLGCLFHFIRALWSKWRKADQFTIKKSKIRRAHVRRCIALAFLPKEYVQDGWLYVLTNYSIFNELYVSLTQKIVLSAGLACGHT